MDPLAVVLIVLALLGGLALGWFVGSRPVVDWKARHAERDAAVQSPALHGEREAEAEAKAAEAARLQDRVIPVWVQVPVVFRIQ